MADIADIIKEKWLIGVLAFAAVGGNGLTFLSEGAETIETNRIAEEFRQADIKQDESDEELQDDLKDLLQRYNDLNTEVALIKQQLGQC